MPHTNSILVLHPDGTFFAQRAKVQHLADNKRAYWQDLAKTILVIVRSTDDQPNNGYEYGGKKSYDRYAVVIKRDERTGVPYKTTSEHIDRTLTPVRDAGGQQVMQLKPKMDRRTSGYAATRRDRLWRPGRQGLQRVIPSNTQRPDETRSESETSTSNP